ncbi:zinc transporter [Pacificimonas flava]|uniref:Zinc transporter n=2 Tax=Pacificimonas TaxID=1960290 RepID=A0A219B2E7_9SPHN|nr:MULTISPECIES: zinc transporter [Pacificimonas]MBZ6377835.1 zinc transporter [Pacificimonas aurantium]OWV32501.1 zinc transporter [Pacificimonas flava]
MLLTLAVVLVVSGALMAGAAWGLYGRLPERLEGFLVAMAGGALIVSVMSELIEPATEHAPVWMVMSAVFVGALAFVGLDKLNDKLFGESGGTGLLLAITIDGIPENLALGVALIGAGPMQVAALAGSILLSNLPEAAGGAKEMAAQDRSKGRVMLLWAATAGLLSLAAIAGNLLLAGTDPKLLGLIRAFAAGAVVSSLATEVFPQAYKQDHKMTGVAVALGLVLAFLLGQLGG